MPFIRSGIIIDAVRRTKGQSAICAAREHYIGAITVAGRPHTGQHVNVVVSRTPGTINRQKDLACQSRWIDATTNQTTAKVDGCYLIESWRARMVRVA